MKSKVNEAEACFSNGFNCCQSVLSTYGKGLGLGEREALKIASGFGAGIAYMGDICGAVTGAFMVIGLKYGRGTEKGACSRQVFNGLSQVGKGCSGDSRTVIK
jgi:C_GCAxxG_C_C family probable redox protein